MAAASSNMDMHNLTREMGSRETCDLLKNIYTINKNSQLHIFFSVSDTYHLTQLTDVTDLSVKLHQMEVISFGWPR